MQQSIGAKVVATSHNNQGTPSQRYTFQMPSWMRNLARVMAGSNRTKKSVLPVTDPNGSTATSIPPSPTPVLHQTLHLMACMRRGRYDRAVFQERVDEISTDKELFYFIKKELAQRRGRFRKWFSLKRIHGLYFVKVGDFVSS
jgi:hypothetical protein